jgi:chromosome segregation ATPase
VSKSTADEPLTYFLEDQVTGASRIVHSTASPLLQVVDRVLEKATQWVKAFAHAKRRADAALHVLREQLEEAREQERVSDVEYITSQAALEQRLKSLSDECASARREQDDAMEQLQSQLDGLSQRLERRNRQHGEDRREAEDKIAVVQARIQT